MRVIQFLDSSDSRRVGLVSPDGQSIRTLTCCQTVYQLASNALEQEITLVQAVSDCPLGQSYQFDELLSEKRVLVPFDHPDSAHMILAGTGLTHLGSAASRDAMHAKLGQASEDITDSMRMFRWGVEGGRPALGQDPVQPEWFYKGDGAWLVPPEGEIPSPPFALDGGEESELAGLYLIDSHGNPRRLGFALANEFSDHAMEKLNYLYLAHSKLRPSSVGPELLIGELPRDIRGTTRILRNGQELWRGEFLTGTDNMSYEIEGLEHHHFKYPGFRRPGDAHCHFFGTSLLSYSSGIRTEAGDVFEIHAAPFTQPLRNTRGQADPVTPPCRPL